MYPLTSQSWDEDSMFSFENERIIQGILSFVILAVINNLNGVQAQISPNFNTRIYYMWISRLQAIGRSFYCSYQHLIWMLILISYTTPNQITCWATTDTQLSQWTYFRQLLLVYKPKNYFLPKKIQVLHREIKIKIKRFFFKKYAQQNGIHL